jgi:hypothetical protein
MEKEFVPYGLALRMKKLKSMDKGFRYGFNEKTFAYFVEGFPNDKLIISSKPKLYSYEYNGGGPELISAPTFSQAFRWFREKYDLYPSINIYNDKWLCLIKSTVQSEIEVSGYIVDTINNGHPTFNTYEEAELACLEKLIEIVESKTEK